MIFTRAKLINNLALVFIVLLSLFIFQSCEDLEKPKLTYQSTNIKNISFEKIDFDVVFDLENINPVAINAITTDYEIYLNNRRFVGGKKALEEVPGRGKTQVVLPVTLFYADLFNGVANLVTAVGQGQKTIPYQVKGTLAAKIVGLIDFTVPIDQTAEIPLPEIPKEKLNQQLQQGLDQLKNQIKF